MAQISGICFDRIIPASQQPARAAAHSAAVARYVAAVQAKAAAVSTDLPPAATFKESVAAIGPLHRLSATDPVHVTRMAIINEKLWRDRDTLHCKFLDGDDFQKGKVKDKADIWLDYATINLEFVDDGDAEIRISFQADPGSWSAIGNDCLVSSYFPANQPTMNFGWLRDDTSDDEYERVVVHEFGHALGCIHEHQSPTENLDWNVDAVYAAFSGPPNNWSKDEIDHNILQKYSPEGISASQFDAQSIMLYQFDGSLFKDGQPTPLNFHLSDTDKQMIAGMYPKKPVAVGAH